MILLLTLLCCVAVLTDGAKMALMPLKMSLAWALVWGVAAYIATTIFCGLSRNEVFALVNISNLSALEFVELLIMLGYIFACGRWKKILSFYPGLMMIVPVCAASFLLAGMFPGLDFVFTGLIAAGITVCILASIIMLFRYASADDNVLYASIVGGALLNIFIYGLV